MSDMERQQIELERQEELLQDLYYLYECTGFSALGAAINIAAALGLSNEFKRMIGG